MNAIHTAQDAWKLLNGVFCIYKPSGLLPKHFRHSLRLNICKDLNEMETRPPQGLVLLKGSVYKNEPFEVEIAPNYADHELVSGPRYQWQDIQMKSTPLGKFSSGVCLVAVNDGCKMIRQLSFVNCLRKYEVKGKLGISTSNFMSDGKATERSTFGHVRQGAIDQILAAIQTSHQSLAYDYCGVDRFSQAAYELASKGLVRPSGDSSPLIYNIKCTHFKKPEFTLSIHCINETEAFLTELIHTIGMELKTNAVCTQLRQVQYGPFTLEHALLRKHWNLENILNNIQLCKPLLNEGKLVESAHLQTVNVDKSRNVILEMQERARDDILC